jgi:Cu+-exporting ATPase
MADTQTNGKVTDPVCGMTIDSATAAGSTQYQGTTYYFCSTACKTKFDASPERFAGSGGSAGGARDSTRG